MKLPRHVGVWPVLSIGLIVTGCRCRCERNSRMRPEAAGVSDTARGTEETRAHMHAVFRTAGKSTGEAYLEAERELRDGGAQAESTLRANRLNPDPMAALLARVLLNWAGEKGSDYDAALEYLDKLPARIAPTPLTTPSPSGVASYLEQEFEDRVADMLTLRLFKEPDWPRWRVIGVLLYLKDHPDKSTAGTILRYAAEAENDEYREFAADALKPSRGADLDVLIDAERQRVENMGKVFPNELAALKSP